MTCLLLVTHNVILNMFIVDLEKKVLIFDMDETLIHCVDDIENEDPDVIIPIDFPDEEETVNVRFFGVEFWLGWSQYKTLYL